MRDFLDVLIIGIILYLIAEFAFIYLKDAIYLARNKNRLAEESIMRTKDAIKAEEFFALERKLKREGYKTAGVYIFHNLNDGRHYVGQSVDLMRRVREHLRGRGNPGIHQSMRVGDKFTIEFIKLSESGFHNLDNLEKHYIRKYDSFRRGYNKTRGNG